jgi:DNA invertase Pin-like site-specific DNA recombinase
MGTAIYVRVSTVGQNEAGQRREISRWLKGNAIDDAKWYSDQESGDTLKRPEFERLQADVFAGEVDMVVVWRLDRLSRSIRDGIGVLTDWCDRGMRVVSVTQQIDFSGAMGTMLVAVLLGVAQMEQEARKERQSVGIAAAKERGVYVGRRKGSTKAKPDRAKQLRASGLTASEIATSLGVSQRSVHRYLAD